MDPNTTSAVRDIFIMVAAGAFAALCAAFLVLIFKLYFPLRQTVRDASHTVEHLSRITRDLAAVSGETSGNVVETSRNAVSISANLKETSEGLPGTLQTAEEAAKSVAAAADSVKETVDMVSRLVPLGVAGGGPPGVAPLLRIFRGLFGGGRRGDDSGVQQNG